MTSKYACDLRVVRLLRQRTLGNSSSAVSKVIEEQHGEKYVTSLESYFSNCKSFQSSAHRGFFGIPHFQRPPPQRPVPRHRWFMKVYQLDVINRLDYIKASITSQFGAILKMDSTKKICKQTCRYFLLFTISHNICHFCFILHNLKIYFHLLFT